MWCPSRLFRPRPGAPGPRRTRRGWRRTSSRTSRGAGGESGTRSTTSCSPTTPSGRRSCCGGTPGFGVRLLDAPAYDGLKGYADGAVTASYVGAQRPLLEATHRLLVATAARPAHTGCFGLHEWAMVYRSSQTDAGTRHPQPLRLGGEGTDTVVESHRIACSHFDAFRFFTDDARPRNTLSPGPHDRPDFEQPGCLHAGMDLYKHAFRLSPMVGSDLVADCFELAWEVRVLDMRAAPYDMTGVVLDPTGEPWTPVRIETPEGKQEYVAQQRAVRRAQPGAPPAAGRRVRARARRGQSATGRRRMISPSGSRSPRGTNPSRA